MSWGTNSLKGSLHIGAPALARTNRGMFGVRVYAMHGIFVVIVCKHVLAIRHVQGNLYVSYEAPGTPSP